MEGAGIRVGDTVHVAATVTEIIEGVGVRVELWSKSDQYDAWVREDLIVHVEVPNPPVEPPNGTWLVGDIHDDGNGSVFRRDDAEGHFDPDRRFDRHWWDYAGAEWIDWPTAVKRGANPDVRLVADGDF